MATIRAVAQGVLGVAFIQAILVGLCLLVAGVPWAGVLAAVVLVLGIAQVPALLVTLPAIVYIWSSGDYGTGAAALYTVLLLVSGMADNVLKPLMLGRGVDAPMPVILLGALGGMATGGHPRDVRRRDPARARLPDLHGLGGTASGSLGRRKPPHGNAVQATDARTGNARREPWQMPACAIGRDARRRTSTRRPRA